MACKPATQTKIQRIQTLLSTGLMSDTTIAREIGGTRQAISQLIQNYHLIRPKRGKGINQTWFTLDEAAQLCETSSHRVATWVRKNLPNVCRWPKGFVSGTILLSRRDLAKLKRYLARQIRCHFCLKLFHPIMDWQTACPDCAKKNHRHQSGYSHLVSYTDHTCPAWAKKHFNYVHNGCNNGNLIGVRQAAKLLQVTPCTIYRLSRLGLLPPVEIPETKNNKGKPQIKVIQAHVEALSTIYPPRR